MGRSIWGLRFIDKVAMGILLLVAVAVVGYALLVWVMVPLWIWIVGLLVQWRVESALNALEANLWFFWVFWVVICSGMWLLYRKVFEFIAEQTQ